MKVTRLVATVEESAMTMTNVSVVLLKIALPSEGFLCLTFAVLIVRKNA